MAYQPTDWKNREVERPRTFTFQENDDGTTTLIPAEGKVTEPGTPIMAPLLNKIEGQLVVLDESRLTDGPYVKPYDGDLNDLTKSGFYLVPAGVPNGVSNNNESLVEVTASGNYVWQKLRPATAFVGENTFERVGTKGSDGNYTWSSGSLQAGWVVKGWRVTTPVLSDSITSSLTTQAATANAVKQVNDKFTHIKVPLAGMIAIGVNANTNGIYGSEMAIGYSSSASGNGAIAIGYESTAPSLQEGVLGTASSVTYGTHKWRVPGSFSVGGTKQFEIPHPHPEKRDTHILRHAAVESPTAGDTLYRYTIEADSGGETVTLQLPDYFEYLNKDVDVWVNGDGHFGRAFGRVEGDTLAVTCELAGSYKVLIIGTRNDDHESVQTWDIKGVEREIGESWTGETYSYEVDEILEVQEITQGVA